MKPECDDLVPAAFPGSAVVLSQEYGSHAFSMTLMESNHPSPCGSGIGGEGDWKPKRLEDDQNTLTGPEVRAAGRPKDWKG